MTYTKEQAQRDLNPHRPACFAMWKWSAEYARSGLGSMGFWNRLSDHRKRQARGAVREILACPEEQTNDH